MESSQLDWIANSIWGIADDVLRDLYVRGKYRDVILPMTVLRRLDAVLEPTKQAVLDMKASLDKAGITRQDQALRQAAGQAFYSRSPRTFTARRSAGHRQPAHSDDPHLPVRAGARARQPRPACGTRHAHRARTGAPGGRGATAVRGGESGAAGRLRRIPGEGRMRRPAG